ncbi:16260_t:CDS:2, partial [Gigaspora rosea]
SYSDENGEEQIEKRTFAVCGGATMENLFSMVFKFQKFHNRSKTVFINGGSHLLVNITAPVRCEEGVNLSVQFDIIRKNIRPIESTLKPLGVDRNIFSDSRRVHALTLTYKFSTPKKNLKISAFLDLLHESYFKDFINDTAEKPTGVENYLEKGEKQAVFIGSEYDYSVYPKDSKPGDLLLERL